ncbi:MAG: ion channel [Thermoanaerobacterales bacterium]|nr:ion channel [Thermoanaerobacterales bacterium]
MSSSRALLYAFLALAVILGGSVPALTAFEDLTTFEAFWLAVVSIATVGYGDYVPVTTAGRITTIVIIFAGVGLFFYAMTILNGVVIEGRILNVWGRRRMQREISRLKDHVIVCGGGRVGQAVIEQLRHERAPLVVIEREGEIIQGPSPDELILAGDTLVVFGPGNRLADLEVKAQRAAPGRAGWRS